MNRYSIVLIGLLLSILLWDATVEPINKAMAFSTYVPTGKKVVKIPYIRDDMKECRAMSLAVSFKNIPYQSSILRIVPNMCLDMVKINGSEPEPIKQMVNRKLPCNREIITADFLPYLKPGKNTLQLDINNNDSRGNVKIKNLHSTGIMLLITLCALSYPILSLILSTTKNLPAIRERILARLPHLLTVSALLPLAILMRIQWFDYNSQDSNTFLHSWLRFIQDIGFPNAYRHSFTNYAPVYTYLLGIMDLYLPTVTPLYIPKILSIFGECFAAFWVYKIVALEYSTASLRPILSSMLFLFLPSVVVNGSNSGQCDILYTSFMLAAVYYIIKFRPNAGLVCWGIAYSFKQQALFIAPFFLIFLLKGKIRWKNLWIPPTVFIATFIPCLLMGRGFMDILMVYWDQIADHPINMNAANIYQYLTAFDPLWAKPLGVLWTAVTAFAIAIVSRKYWRDEITPVACMLLATLSVALIPFLMPCMHDRYFYPAEVFSLVLACLRPRWLIIPLLFQVSVFATLPGHLILRFTGWVGWIQNLGIINATWLNGIAIVIMIWLCRRHVWTAMPKCRLESGIENCLRSAMCRVC